ncbi:hypothetical protein ACIQCV_16080 [Dietzia maris]
MSSIALAAVGRADDVNGLPVVARLGTQVAVGMIAGWRAGGLRGLVAGAAMFPVVVNTFNFMDGINGISAGTSISWGACIATDPGLTDQLRVQGSITAGMGLGFLPFNAPNASMFLGDVGSYLLGAGIAMTATESLVASHAPSSTNVFRAVAPLSIYLADTGSTIMRRAVRGRPLAEAHREHVYQKLVHEHGLPHWGVSALVASLSFSSGLAGRSASGLVVIPALVSLYLCSPYLAKRFVAEHRRR